MKRLAICSIAVLALLTSCGVAKDDIAATVNGHDITVSEVRELAKSEFMVVVAQKLGVGLVQSTNGTTGAPTLRLALSLLVQAAVYEDEAKARGVEVSPDAESTAGQRIDSVKLPEGSEGAKPLSKGMRSRLVRWLSTKDALGAALDIPEAPVVDPEPVTPEQVADYMERIRDQLGEMTCFDGFVVAVASRDVAQAAIDRGDDVDTILADPALAAQGVVEQGTLPCLSRAQVNNPTLGPLVFDGPIGQWASADIDSTNPDNPAESVSFAVFIRPTVRDDATRIPQVVDAITQSLEAEAQQTADAANQQAQAAQADIDKALADLVRAADIEVDPRYGSFDAAADGVNFDLVKAPPAPVDKAPTTTEPSLLDPAAG